MNSTLIQIQFSTIRVYICEFLFALYSLLVLSFFLYLKMVLYARDCSCNSRQFKYNVYSSKNSDLQNDTFTYVS